MSVNTDQRGLNRRIRGGARAISMQAKDRHYTPDDAYSDLKWLATTEGYPKRKRHMKLRGKLVTWEEPETMAGQTVENAMKLWMTMQVFADERGLWLVEYDENEKPFRTVGGRTKKEMEVFIAELRMRGLNSEADELAKPVRFKDEPDIF